MRQLSLSLASLIRSLHQRKGRTAEGAYLAEGERLVRELPSSPATVRFIFADEESAPGIAEAIPEAPLFVLPRKNSNLFATDNAQGVGAVVEIPEPVRFEDLLRDDLPLLYIDHLADPGNLGTIVRTADWFGHRSVILSPGCVDPYNPKSVRGTMGAIFRMKITQDVGVEDLLQSRRPLVALDAGGGERLGDAPLPKNAIYVVGGEAHGLSGELKGISRLLSIQGSGGGESLNAAVAAGILLYELRGR